MPTAVNTHVRKPLCGIAKISHVCKDQPRTAIRRTAQRLKQLDTSLIETCRTMRQQLPLIAHAKDLALGTEASTADICRALKAVRNRPNHQTPRVLFLNDCAKFDDSCINALLSLLRRKPRILAINIGDDAGKCVTNEGWQALLSYARGPGGARLPCQYLSDTHCAAEIRHELVDLVGKARRESTEADARKLIDEAGACKLIDDEAGARKLIEQARRLVPWRCPRLHAALQAEEQDACVRWGKPTWHPKSTWSALK